MSALTEKVAREHRAVGIVGACTCGDHPRHLDSADHHRTWHLIEVTEQAVRANVAAEIRAERTQVLTGDVAGQFEAAALGLAARIAEGKQP